MPKGFRPLMIGRRKTIVSPAGAYRKDNCQRVTRGASNRRTLGVGGSNVRGVGVTPRAVGAWAGGPVGR